MTSTTVEPELTEAGLAGIWLRDPDTLVSFAPDGRYWIDTSGALAHAPDVVGTYELVGAETRFTETMDSADCEAGMKSSWHATVEDGTMTAEWIEHDCYPDAAGQTWELARVSPDIRWVPRLTEDPPSTFAADEGNLRGAWLIVGTSALIEFDGQGSYAWDDQGQLAWAPAETGTYQVENGTLELTVDSSTTCAVEDRVRLSDASMYSTADAFRVMTADADDDCGRITGPITIVLISS